MIDGELTARLAGAAGRLLLEVRTSGVFTGMALGAAGDTSANQFLCHAIRAARRDDGLLSEEKTDNAERLIKGGVWIIDPVDGTRAPCVHCVVALARSRAPRTSNALCRSRPAHHASSIAATTRSEGCCESVRASYARFLSSSGSTNQNRARKGESLSVQNVWKPL